MSVWLNVVSLLRTLIPCLNSRHLHVRYAISNVGEEYMVRKYQRAEWLGMIGIWGTIISAIQLYSVANYCANLFSAILERGELSTLKWDSSIGMYWKIVLTNSVSTPWVFTITIFYVLIHALYDGNGKCNGI